MKTAKEVAGLTGISVRTLQYCDEIGCWNYKSPKLFRQPQGTFPFSAYMAH